jgi:hypothetical protein
MRLSTVALTAIVVLAAVSGCGDDDDPVTPNQAMIRVAHLSPDAPNVDVWVDGARVLQNVPFQTVSDYLEVTAGDRRIQVTPAGATTPAVIDATVPFARGKAYTVAATGLLGNGDLEPIVLEDERSPAAAARVRFVHTSPDAPAVDVAVTGGPVLFGGVQFREADGYLNVDPGSYDLEARLAGTSTVALSVPDVALSGSTNYTIFAIGLAGNGTLSVLPVVDTP